MKTQARKPQQEQAQEKPSQERILKTAVANRWKLRLKLFEGEEITGTLQVFDPYSLTLTTEDNRIILVYKHAIKYVEPVLPS